MDMGLDQARAGEPSAPVVDWRIGLNRMLDGDNPAVRDPDVERLLPTAVVQADIAYDEIHGSSRSDPALFSVQL